MTPVTHKDFCVCICTFTCLPPVFGYTLSHAGYMPCTFKPCSAHPHSTERIIQIMVLDSASNRNEYQEYLLGVQPAGA